MRFSFKVAFALTLSLLSIFVSKTWADGTPAIDFKKTVLPILQNSCFACHVSGTKVTLPTDPDLAKKANKEIADAMEDFTMGNQFPFPCDEPVAKQIKHLEKTLSKGFMPPHSQTKLGLGSPLSDDDRKTLLAWVAQQKQLLK